MYKVTENRTKIGSVLVTGGTGFLGIHLVKKLLKRYTDITVRTISRNENEVQKAIRIFNSERVEPIVADIRDSNPLKDTVKGIDCLIHLAAMKHVDLCEMDSLEATSINVVGTINLLNLFDGNTFIGMSTDKALEPKGCYGATKLLLEKLIIEKAKYHQDRRYVIVRSGNILGSSGSVVDKWVDQIRQRNEIVATRLKMTRFFIDADSLTDFMLEVMEHGETGKVYVPFQKALELKDLAEAVILLIGNKNTKIREVGLRPGEKEHEVLFLSDERKNVVT
ncbi:unnamed protein product, partial [marine sediment metagenome]